MQVELGSATERSQSPMCCLPGGGGSSFFSCPGRYFLLLRHCHPLSLSPPALWHFFPYPPPSQPVAPRACTMFLQLIIERDVYFKTAKGCIREPAQFLMTSPKALLRVPLSSDMEQLAIRIRAFPVFAPKLWNFLSVLAPFFIFFQHQIKKKKTTLVSQVFGE